ncbi:MAG: tetratricopeptide repeat protein [Azospira sp.]|jgi:Flp pilus assembly protein TadD/ketosteroid isomerase-like protein|nr:tetratricopeptide repeat protein [Azospira sp.]
MHTPFQPRLRPFRQAAALIALTACLTMPAAHADDLADARKLMQAGQHAQALGRVDAYIARNPRDAQGRFVKGVILTELKRPDEAIAVFTQLTKDHPERPEPYNNLAVLYAQQKQYDKARTALEMAIRTHPAYATAYENLGDVYARLASQAYGKALQLDSASTAAQGKLALIHDLTGSAAPTGGKTAVAAKPAVPDPKPAAQPDAGPAPTKVATATPAKEATPPATAPAKEAAGRPVPAAAAQKEKAVEAPTAVKETTGKAADANEAALVAAVQGWATAWAKKDVRAYLAHYAPAFQTPNGMSRSAWENERRQRIDRPGKILVEVDDFRVTVNGDKATVRFRQSYRSNTFRSTTGKSLIFVRSGGKWLIQQERVG